MFFNGSAHTRNGQVRCEKMTFPLFGGRSIACEFHLLLNYVLCCSVTSWCAVFAQNAEVVCMCFFGGVRLIWKSRRKMRNSRKVTLMLQNIVSHNSRTFCSLLVSVLLYWKFSFLTRNENNGHHAWVPGFYPRKKRRIVHSSRIG